MRGRGDAASGWLVVQFITLDQTVHVSPSQTAEGDDGFVYFNTTGSEAPETASKGELLTRGWQGR